MTTSTVLAEAPGLKNRVDSVPPAPLMSMVLVQTIGLTTQAEASPSMMLMVRSAVGLLAVTFSFERAGIVTA